MDSRRVFLPTVVTATGAPTACRVAAAPTHAGKTTAVPCSAMAPPALVNARAPRRAATSSPPRLYLRARRYGARAVTGFPGSTPQ
jgi:hypothetical protein